MKIQAKNLIKTYGDKKVLDLNTLTIERGKITGLIGPNGCGKSTLVNIIAGLDEEYQGQVLYDGKTIDKDIRDKMTLVFQSAYLFRRSVYKNIAYPLKIRNESKENIEKKVSQMLNVLEIEDLKMKMGNKLSGGETQKVALARALVFNPDLLLLDEPTSNIDPEYILHMEKAIIKYNKENKGTIIIVTHNIDQAERLCHRIIKLERGKVID